MGRYRPIGALTHAGLFRRSKLSEQERQAILDAANEPSYANLPPSQIVPTLLDEGVYLGSGSSF
jgi:putative transposase